MQNMGGHFVNQRMFRDYLLESGLNKKTDLLEL